MKIRDMIYDEIRRNPGIHLRDLQRRLNLSTGTLTYNLRVLEKKGLVYSKTDGGFKRYYTLDLHTENERRIVGILRLKTPRRILSYLFVNPGKCQQEIASYLNLSAPTISHYLKILLKYGLIEEIREKNTKRYWIKKEREEEIRELLTRYKDSFLDKVVESLIEMIIE